MLESIEVEVTGSELRHSSSFWAGRLAAAHLKVEDAAVRLAEALAVRNHTVQQTLIQGQGANGGQQPAVT